MPFETHSDASDEVGRARQNGLRLLCVTAFLLAGMPRASIRLAGMPLYFIDVTAAMTLFFAIRNRRRDSTAGQPATLLVIFFLGGILAGQLRHAAHFGAFFEPLYILVRYLLATSLFFSTRHLLQSYLDLMQLVKALVLGLIVTASLVVGVALPLTRPLCVNYVFANSVLEPASDQAIERYGQSDRADRGRSLVGTSTLSGGFITTLWPFAFLLYSWRPLSNRWRAVSMIACFLAPFGAVMTYARGTVLGIMLAGLILLTFRRARARTVTLAIVVLCFGVFQLVGWDSEAFLFSRLINRTRAAIEDPLEHKDERERTMSFIEPFVHLAQNPEWFLMGAGDSGGHADPTVEPLYARGELATHSTFAMSYYSFGMVAALSNATLLLFAFVTIVLHIRCLHTAPVQDALVARTFFAVLGGMFPWWVTGHGAASTPRGAMLFFLVIGVVSMYSSLRQASSSNCRRMSDTPNNVHHLPAS